MSVDLDTRQHSLLNAAEDALGRWQAYRLYPDQYFVEMAEAMRRLDQACEAYAPEDETG